MKLIVGLGNPGSNYANNRHNIGFVCVSHLSKTHDIRFDRKQGQARTGIGNIAGHRVVLARPQTYMNASGESVSALLRRLNLAPSDLIAIHDDLDLPAGKIRLRLGGSSGGHKGINSIIAHLGSRDFSRFRVGIGRPEPAERPEVREAEIIDYVLSDFTREEKETMAQTIPKVTEAILCLLTEGLAAAMNKYN